MHLFHSNNLQACTKFLQILVSSATYRPDFQNFNFQKPPPANSELNQIHQLNLIGLCIYLCMCFIIYLLVLEQKGYEIPCLLLVFVKHHLPEPGLLKELLRFMFYPMNLPQFMIAMTKGHFISILHFLSPALQQYITVNLPYLPLPMICAHLQSFSALKFLKKITIWRSLKFFL